MYSITGIVKVIKDLQQVTDTFKKREFVITDNSGNYPQDILFQTVQDRVNILDNLNEGDTVNVTFFIRGREWINPQGEALYFNSLDAWKLEKVGVNNPAAQTSAQAPQQQSESASTAAENTASLSEDDDDDLPF